MALWIRRARGALFIGVTWAVAWGLAGLCMGVASVLTPWLPWDRFFAVFDAPLPALAVPGFIAGVLFSALIGVVSQRTRVEELAMRRFMACGALGGALVTCVPLILVMLGLASSNGPLRTLLHAMAVVIGPFVTLAALSSSVTLWLAQRAPSDEEHHTRETGAHHDEQPQIPRGRDDRPLTPPREPKQRPVREAAAGPERRNEP
jgi:hypothetical protein